MSDLTVSHSKDIASTIVPVIVGRYGSDARAVVECQIEAAKGNMRERWIAV